LNPSAVKVGLLGAGRSESYINQKFTDSHYLSLSHLPATSSTGCLGSKGRL